MWSREPTTITANLNTQAKLISTCEMAGLKPNLPKLGPLPCVDEFGYFVAFSMLLHSTKPGRHDRTYTQFATIRKQRAAFSNLYFALAEVHGAKMIINSGSQSNGILSHCPTNLQWFNR